MQSNKVIYYCTEFNTLYSTFADQFEFKRDIEFATDKNLEKYESFLETTLTNLIITMYTLNKKCSFYHGDLHRQNFLCTENGAIKMFDFDFSGILKHNSGQYKPVENTQVSMYPWHLTEAWKRNMYLRREELFTSGPGFHDREYMLFFDLHRVFVSIYTSGVKKDLIMNCFDKSPLSHEFKKKLLWSIFLGKRLIDKGHNWNYKPMVGSLFFYYQMKDEAGNVSSGDIREIQQNMNVSMQKGEINKENQRYKKPKEKKNSP